MGVIKVKAPITGWHEVTREQAVEFAVSRYVGMTCRNKTKKVNELIKGVSFDETELLHRANERNGKGITRTCEARNDC